MAVGRRSYRSRGRAGLLGAAGLFVLAQLVAGLALDRFGLAVRFPSAARVLAAVPPSGPDIVFLGSSRFQGLNADEAAKWLRLEHPTPKPIQVHNASVPGGDPIAADYVMQELLAGGARPRLAVIEVSPDTLNHYNQLFALHSHRQIQWREVPTYLLDVCRAGELKKLVKARLVPLYAHRTELCRQCGLALARMFQQAQTERLPSPPQTSTAVSYAPQPLPWDAMLQISLPPLTPADVQLCQAWVPAMAKRFRDYRPGGTTTAALERLLNRCQSQNIDVILIGAPNSSFYRQNFTPEITAAYRNYLNHLTKAYRCRFVDYSDQMPDQLFQEPVHLNPVGYLSFTCRLTHDVLSPYWLEHGPHHSQREPSAMARDITQLRGSVCR